MNLEQIVMKVIAEVWQGPCLMSSGLQADILEYSRRLVAALGAQEPVAQVDMNKASCVRWLNSTDPDTFHGTKLYAASQLPQREGWQLVPKDYTYAMHQAWLEGNSFDERYKAMLAAAPKPEDV